MSKNVLLRFARAAIAAAVAGGLKYMVENVTSLPIDPLWIPVFTGLIMALDKQFRMILSR